jgi:branched-chain amino acid transport system ATP-binding protein
VSALLRLDRVNTFYGAVQAHFDLSLEVGGQIVCLLGGNASGKSTTMKVILGLVRRARDGDLRRRPITACRPHRRSSARHRLGARGAALFPLMSVRENLLMGAYAQRPQGVAEDLERMLELFPRVASGSAQRAGTLSGGEQQMVAMARALMGRPRLICMDEPTMGLSPLYVDRVLELIAEPSTARASRSSWSSRTPIWPCRSPTRAMCCRPAASSCRARPRLRATRAFATPISAAPIAA